MSNKSVEVTTPVGRLVNGHPMNSEVVTDNKTGLVVMTADSVTPRTNTFFALAIAKGAEKGWRETTWGQLIFNCAVADFPNGAHQRPDFAWKIEDGDSQVPNKKGKKNCDREGYPGHWVLRLSTGLPIRCFHDGRFDPTQQIQRKEEIKPGDYCRAALLVRGNDRTDSPGVYLNPDMFALTRAGIEIQLGEQRAATDAFSGAAVLPANAHVDPNAGVAPAPGPGTPPPAAGPGTPPPAVAGPSATPAGVTPAPDFAAGPSAPPAGPSAPPAAAAEPLFYDLNGGGPFAKSLLVSAGYTDAHFATLRQA